MKIASILCLLACVVLASAGPELYLTVINALNNTNVDVYNDATLLQPNVSFGTPVRVVGTPLGQDQSVLLKYFPTGTKNDGSTGLCKINTAYEPLNQTVYGAVAFIANEVDGGHYCHLIVSPAVLTADSPYSALRVVVISRNYTFTNPTPMLHATLSYMGDIVYGALAAQPFSKYSIVSARTYEIRLTNQKGETVFAANSTLSAGQAYSLVAINGFENMTDFAYPVIALTADATWPAGSLPPSAPPQDCTQVGFYLTLGFLIAAVVLAVSFLVLWRRALSSTYAPIRY